MANIRLFAGLCIFRTWLVIRKWFCSKGSGVSATPTSTLCRTSTIAVLKRIISAVHTSLLSDVCHSSLCDFHCVCNVIGITTALPVLLCHISLFIRAVNRLIICQQTGLLSRHNDGNMQKVLPLKNHTTTSNSSNHNAWR